MEQLVVLHVRRLSGVSAPSMAWFLLFGGSYILALMTCCGDEAKAESCECVVWFCFHDFSVLASFKILCENWKCTYLSLDRCACACLVRATCWHLCVLSPVHDWPHSSSTIRCRSFVVYHFASTIEALRSLTCHVAVITTFLWTVRCVALERSIRWPL